MIVPQAAIDKANEIIHHGTDEEQLAFFAFDDQENDDVFQFKFQTWAGSIYGRYFKSPPADFHDNFIRNMRHAYEGDIKYTNLGFRN